MFRCLFLNPLYPDRPSRASEETPIVPRESRRGFPTGWGLSGWFEKGRGTGIIGAVLSLLRP